MIAPIGGTQQVISVTQKAVIGVSLEEGRVLWEHPWAGGGAGGTMPVLDGETIIASASGLGTIAIRPVRQGGQWIISPVWEPREVSRYLSNPVVIDHTLFGLSQRASGQFFALDALNGKVLWLGSPREAMNTAVAKACEILFLLNDDGELIVAKASRTGFVPVKRYTVAERRNVGPARHFRQPILHQGSLDPRVVDA